MTSSTYILLLGITLLLTLVSADEQYVAFSYSGESGPDKWANLSPSYAKCGNGKSQSPIDIKKDDAVLDSKLQALARNYSVTNATLINNGFNIGISFGNNGAGTALFNGKNYTLKQMHWHSPSEHTFDGQRSAAELHLVHKGSDGSVVVVAVLYDSSGKGHDPLIKQLMEGLNKLKGETCGNDQETQVPLETLKTKHLNRKSRKYYTYVGSLTIPPCFENVSWVILGKVRAIRADQVEALKAPLGAAFKNNSRPVQPLNGRKVQLYSERGDPKKQ